jgi:hypothetical protein
MLAFGQVNSLDAYSSVVDRSLKVKRNNHTHLRFYQGQEALHTTLSYVLTEKPEAITNV